MAASVWQVEGVARAGLAGVRVGVLATVCVCVCVFVRWSDWE